MAGCCCCGLPAVSGASWWRPRSSGSSGTGSRFARPDRLIEPLRTLLVDPFNVWLIRIRRIRADQGFEARDGGIFLDEATRRLWLKTWSTYMAERVTLADGRQGPRWELVDGLVRAFVRFVYAPVDGLVVPQRR